MKSDPALFVGIDVGGQSIKGGVVAEDGRRFPDISVPTEAHRGADRFLGQVELAVNQALAAADKRLNEVTAIGIATPGTMDLPAGMMLEPPNMKPLRNVPIRQHIADRFQKPTAFQNDANAAAYGEYCFGAGRDAASIVLFTLGTGIGCGIIVNDFIIEGAHSHGAECGHLIIEMTNGRMCGCGQRGHLEAYASARAMVKRAREALAESPLPGPLRDQLGPYPGPAGRALSEEEETLDARYCSTVFQCAEAGDPLAARLVAETAYYLAVGTVNLLHTINPHRVIFGGGMIAAGTKFLDQIRAEVRRIAFPVPGKNTELVYAQLGGDAGFIGAAACARRMWRLDQTRVDRAR